MRPEGGVDDRNQGPQEDAVPSPQRMELLRGLAQGLEEGRDLAEHLFNPGGVGVWVGDGDASLSAVAGEVGRGV